MDPTSIVLIIGLCTLIVNELAKSLIRVKHSKCWGVDIEMDEPQSSNIRK